MPEGWIAVNNFEIDLNNRFEYHPPLTQAKVSAHEAVRGTLWEAATKISNLCPEGREASLAITKLEEAMFWANAAIARR
jgi:hypothetical protein